VIITKLCEECIALFEVSKGVNYCTIYDNYVDENNEQCETGKRVIRNYA
jgi:hypothetical protein